MIRFRSLYLVLLSAVLLIPAKHAISRDRVEQCPKRTFGYDQPWAPRMTNPVLVASPTLSVSCSVCSDMAPLAMNSAPILAATDGSASHLVVSPLGVVVLPSTFRLSVACPGNAVVIIDGQRTTSTDPVRQYELNLPIGVLSKAVEIVVVDQHQRVLKNATINVSVGGTGTLVVSRHPDQASITKANATTQEVSELKSEISELTKDIKALMAIQPKVLSKRKRDLDARDLASIKDQAARDAMQDARNTLQDERDALQQRRDKLQSERDALQIGREADFSHQRDALKAEAAKAASLQSVRDKLQIERETLQDARDKLQRERDELQQRRDKLQGERDSQK